MRIAIHQPNFIPWFPFFYKMAMVDVFVLLYQVQFEKNGFQNRCKVNGKWWTKSVKKGLDPIYKKEYADGTQMLPLNWSWIRVIKDTLGIKTELKSPRDTHDKFIHADNPTDLIIKTCKEIQQRDRMICGVKVNSRDVVYVTNPSAKDKYLDEDKVIASGIGIEYCKVPKHLNKHVFECFDEFGFEGTKKQLPQYVPQPNNPEIEKYWDEYKRLNSIAVQHGTESKEYKNARSSSIL